MCVLRVKADSAYCATIVVRLRTAQQISTHCVADRFSEDLEEDANKMLCFASHGILMAARAAHMSVQL